MASFFSRSVLLLLGASASLAQAGVCARAGCNADNCARAVTGTRLGPASETVHRDDCSSFLRTTIIPTVTSTVTVNASGGSVAIITSTASPVLVAQTNTSFVDIPTTTGVLPQKRADDITSGGASLVTPTAVPTYASACSGAVRYSSACSCFGVTGTTVTATSAATVSVTVTATGGGSGTSVEVITPTKTTTQIVVATEVINCEASYTPTPPRGPDDFDVFYTRCGEMVSFDTEEDGNPFLANVTSLGFGDCKNRCNAEPRCFAFSFQISTDECVLSHDGPDDSNEGSDFVYVQYLGPYQ